MLGFIDFMSRYYNSLSFFWSILLILVVVLTLYTLKRKCMSPRKALARDYAVSEVKPTGSKYDTLQEAGRVGTDTAAEYIEITVITG